MLSEKDFSLLKSSVSSYELRLDRYIRKYPDCPDNVRDYHLTVRDLYYKLFKIS